MQNIIHVLAHYFYYINIIHLQLAVLLKIFASLAKQLPREYYILFVCASQFESEMLYTDFITNFKHLQLP